jgi:metal-sulfur cluster biosynthetic enzyme
MEGVDRVQTEVVMQPPWSPEKMSEFAKSALGFF